ncbi:MAG: hypothetical protein WDN69_01255 [Aliidongia sp.]
MRQDRAVADLRISGIAQPMERVLQHLAMEFGAEDSLRRTRRGQRGGGLGGKRTAHLNS